MAFWQIALIIVGGLVLLLIILSGILRLIVRNAFLSTKVAGSETPADKGLEYEEHWIMLDGRRLQAWYAPGQEVGSPVLLLFQGGNDTISELGHLQKYLYDYGFGSLAFDFSGNGNSSGKTNVEHINADGIAAYELLSELVGEDTPIIVWGFSLGAARALAALSDGQLDAAGVFLVGPFTSTRDAAHHVLPLPRLVIDALVPQYWDNHAALNQITTPVWILHSVDDELAPYTQGAELASESGDKVHLVTLEDLKHNDCWQPLHEEYWEPVFRNIERLTQ